MTSQEVAQKLPQLLYWDSFSYKFKGYYHDEVIFTRPIQLQQIRILRNSHNPFSHLKNSPSVTDCAPIRNFEIFAKDISKPKACFDNILQRGEYNQLTLMIFGEILESDKNLYKLFDEIDICDAHQQVEGKRKNEAEKQMPKQITDQQRLKKYLQDLNQNQIFFQETLALIKILRFLVQIQPNELVQQISSDTELIRNLCLFVYQAHYDKRLILCLDKILKFMAVIASNSNGLKSIAQNFASNQFLTIKIKELDFLKSNQSFSKDKETNPLFAKDKYSLQDERDTIKIQNGLQLIQSQTQPIENYRQAQIVNNNKMNNLQ
eukprot:403339292